MVSTVLQSEPAASSELAVNAVNGLIGQAGNGKIVKVLNIDVREVNGEFIAVAMIEIEDPQAEQKQEETREREQEPVAGANADKGDHSVDLYYLHAHMSEAERAIPDVDAQNIPQTDLDGTQPAITPENTNAESANADNDRDADIIAGPASLTPDSESLSEKIQNDFAVADAPAYNVDPKELAAEQLADKPLDRMSPRELEELKEEVEERLKTMPPEAAPVPEEAVNPNPSA